MYKVGDIVLVNFPFSDFNNFKLRPVLVWKDLGEDFIVMPITTSKINIFGEYLLKKDKVNNLKVDSFLKPFNVNTIDKNIIIGRLGKLGEKQIFDVKEIFCGGFCRK